MGAGEVPLPDPAPAEYNDEASRFHAEWLLNAGLTARDIGRY
jgi:hypothetical protein